MNYFSSLEAIAFYQNFGEGTFNPNKFLLWFDLIYVKHMEKWWIIYEYSSKHSVGVGVYTHVLN